MVDSSFRVRAISRAPDEVSLLWSLQHATVMPAGAANLFTVIGLDPMMASFASSGGTLGFQNSHGEQQMCEATIPLTTHAREDAVWEIEAVVDGMVPSASGLRVLHARAQTNGTSAEVAAYAVADVRMLAHFLSPSCVNGADNFPACASLACGLVEPTLHCEPCPDGEKLCLSYAMHATAAAAPGPKPLTVDAVCSQESCSDEPECK